MTSTVHDDQATTGQGRDTPVVVRQPGTGGVHEWLPYAVTVVSALLVVFMFIAIGNQRSGSSTSKPGTGVATGPQLTTTLAPTSFSVTCTLTKGPGYQSVTGQITSNASSAADVTVTYDVLDASGTRVLGSAKPFKHIVKGTPAPWQSSERGTPAGANCTAKVTTVTAAG